MKKLKVFSVLMILVLFGALIVGCAPANNAPEDVVVDEPAVEEPAVEEPEVEEPEEEEKEPVTLTVWTEYATSPKSDMAEYWVETFEAKYPWITVESRVISQLIGEEALRVGLLGSEAPDIFHVQSRGEVVDYVEAGLLYDLTDFYNERADRFASSFDALSEWQSVVGGKRWAIPYTVLHINLIWYNVDMLDTYGIDADSIVTLDDLMAACDVLDENGEICFQLGAGSTWPAGHWSEFFIQQNLPEESWYKLATGEKKWADPDIVDAVSYLEEFYNRGYFQPGVAADSRDTTMAAHFQGNGAFFAAGSWHLYNKGGDLAPPDWEFKFIPFPVAADSVVENPVLSTNNVLWAVHADTDVPEEALLFLDHVLSLETAQKHVEMLQEFLVIEGSVTPDNASEEFVAIAEWAEAGTGINWLENYFTREVINEALWGGATGVLSGQITTLEWMQLIDETQARTGNLEFEE